jgi:transglutaminase-like putative cysteine protease
MCRLILSRYLCLAGVSLLLFINSFSQTDLSANIAAWRSLFPKEDVIGYSYKETISFSLNTDPKPGEGNVKANVINEITLVPVKDFIKYEDGLFYYDEMVIDNVKAINPKGKEVIVQKLCGSYKDDDIFHSDTRYCSVKFPLEEKGKSFTYRYEENYRDVKYLTSFYFHSHLPVVERIIEFNIPSWLETDLREFNFKNNAIEKSSVKNGDVTRITFTIKNLPSFHREPSSPNHALSFPHIICVNKAYTQNGQRKVLFESVKDLYGWYNTVCADIGNKPAELKDRVTNLMAGKKTDIEKIESIFYWVQDNIRYIAFENGIMGFKPDAAQNVLKNKYGDCKGKANLLKEMLKLAGYDARLTWIGTSDLPYDYSLPSLAVDNHMICTVTLNGKRYFLDGTEPFIALNDYAQRIQGKQVLIEDGKNYILDRIPDFPAERNRVKKTSHISLDNDVIKGTTMMEYNGESKSMLQAVYSSIRNEDKTEALSDLLKRSDNNVVVSNVQPPDFKERQKPITVNFEFKANNQVKKVANEIYVVMDWDKEFSGLEFDKERKNDYEFNYKYNYTIQTELAVPDGYKVDYIPAAFKKNTPDYSFEGTYTNKGKTILYNKTIVVNKPVLLKTEFEKWNTMTRSYWLNNHNFFMKQLFFCCLLFFAAASIEAQIPALGETIEPEFSVTAIPDKWNKESAVIIGQKTEYLFTRLASGKKYTTIVRINEYIHKRIKLQDKNAQEKFSTFYYVTMGKDGKAAYQIIKANGKRVEVDMKSAIEEENDIPAIYKPIYYRLNIKYYKIAIPDLEVGDIIDYSVRSTIDWDMRENGIGFTPFIFSLSNSYATIYQQYRFIMANGMKVKFRAFNGASNLKMDTKSSVFGDKESYVTYYMLDKDREKTTEERWSYELRNTPSVKFRVIMLADNDPESKELGMATVDRTFIDIGDVYKRYVGAALYRTTTVNTLVAYTTEYVSKKKEAGILKNDDDIIRECYYCLRKVFLEMYYKGPVHSELEKYMTGKKLYKKVLKQQEKDNQKKEEREDEIRINGVLFATAFRTALAAQSIQSELFVYMPRRLGAWRDAVFLDELDFVMKVKSKRRNYFLEAFNNFDAFASPYSYLEGTEGYSIGYDEPDKYYKTPGPNSTFGENIARKDYEVKFTEAMDIINVERVSILTGHEKTGKIGVANLDREYLGKDFEKYYNQPGQKGKKKKEDEVIDITSSLGYDNPDKEEKVKERNELMEKDIKEEFDIEKYGSFELLDNGRYGDTAALKYKETFSLKKLISRAGRNYLIEAGKLIGDQIKLEQKELESRQGDIWIPNARTIENNITINVPAGYAVEGLQELNMSVDNESGAFISTAKTEGDKLLIITKKLYKKNFDKKELWPNYVAFLEAGYKFSQAKIVLKKK